MERLGWEERVRQSRFWREGVFHPRLFQRSDVRSAVTRFLLVVLAVWSEKNPWSL